jgi:hypothetical protein
MKLILFAFITLVVLLVAALMTSLPAVFIFGAFMKGIIGI